MPLACCLQLPLGTALGEWVLKPLFELTGDKFINIADLVGILEKGLNALGVSSLLNDVLDTVADALLSNTLTLLQVVELKATLTEYDFVGETEISGNVIGNGSEGDLADTLASGGMVSKVQGADGVTVMVMDTADSADNSTTVFGQYGTLTISESGAYTYQLNDRNGIGKSETFSYTITDGFTSGTADLVIQIKGDAAVDDAAVAGVIFKNATLPEESITLDDAVVYRWTLGFDLLGLTVVIPLINNNLESKRVVVREGTTQDLSLAVNGGPLLSVGAGMTVYLEKEIAKDNWQTEEMYNSAQLISLLGIDGNGTILIEDVSAGEYRLRMEVDTGAVSLAGSVSVNLTTTVNDLTSHVVDSTQLATGNILANDVIVAATYTLKVQDATDTFKDVMANGSTTITGEYGTLLMQADGSYTYTPFTTLTDPATPLSDTFSYQVVCGDRTETSTLTVHLQSSGTGTQSHEMADGTALELATMANSGIESIIMQDGTGISSLNLTVADVNNLQTTGADTLYVYGDAADKVTLTDAFQKTAIVTDTNGVVMTEYSSGTTKVLIDNDIVAVGGVII